MSPGLLHSDAVGHRGQRRTGTGCPAARDAGYAGTDSACTPTIRTAGSRLFTATVIPAASPPPPTGTRIVRTCGHCSMISKPRVPWPATMSGVVERVDEHAPVAAAKRSASSSASSTDEPCSITDAP